MTIAVLAAACSGGSKPSATPAVTEPPPTTVSTPSIPTWSTTSPSVRSTTTTSTTRPPPVSIGPGEASISGTVVGPGGPVDGATVRIERLVGSAVASADVTTSGGGAWRMDSVLGGAYRIRAFKAPDLTQSNVEVFFLPATERRTIDLRLAGAGGPQITVVVNPNPPRVNQSATITVQIGTDRLDDQGRPAVVPLIGAVLQFSLGAGQALESSPQGITDANGTASWRFRCLVEGPVVASVATGGGVTQLNVAPCAAVNAGPAPTTTTTKPR